MNLNFVVTPQDESAVRAGYSCPCGCQQKVSYQRGGPDVTDACCCGNHFAVGRGATTSLESSPGDRLEVQGFTAPWGEELQAAWALVQKPSHGPGNGDGDHDHAGETDGHGHSAHADATDVAGATLDPVCGMTVEPEAARAKGLHSTHAGTEYFFCGKGCKLEFDEDPERYLDPGYVPSM